MPYKSNYFVIIIFFIALTSCFSGCQTGSEHRVAIEKDGKIYGVTKGAFRHRWWNYYERGTSFSGGRFWREAEADFREALSQWDGDRRRERTYGMHFMDYFPHRELGVTLFHQNRYTEAIRELEISLSKEKSAKAEYYLDKTRKARIEQENSDKGLPEISIESPGDKTLSGHFSIKVRGVVKDDTFVKEIRVNGNPIRIDLATPQIPFETEVPLTTGENTIVVEAADLTGKTSETVRKVLCDRAGPILNIDSFTPANDSEDHYILRGYAYDDSGIKEVRVNGLGILESPVPQISLNHTVIFPAGQKKVVVIAEDQAGNQTRAEISPSVQKTGFSESGKMLLASLDSFLHSSPPFVKGAGGIFDAKKNSCGRNPPRPPFAKGGRNLRNVSYLRSDYYAMKASLLPLKARIKHYRRSGKNYALIAGINAYTEWPVLNTAVNDAAELKNVLTKRYEFPEKNVILRTDKDATRVNLIRDIRRLAAGLTQNDNLLIYFAGHGRLDDLTSDGYWIPVEGKLGDPTTWITNSVIKSILTSEKVRGKNIAVVADSCYSANLLRGGSSSLSFSDRNYQERLLELARKKSRQIFTSGGMEPVADSGRDNHSLFAYYFLRALKENTCDIIDLENLLLTKVWKPVSEKGGQRPNTGRLKTPMDEDGQFILILKSGKSGDAKKKTVSSKSSGDSGVRRAGLPSANDILPDSTPPVLELRRWEKGRTVFLDSIWLEGSARDDSGIQRLTVNGQKILKCPGKNVYFNHLSRLREGENRFIFECSDQVGNRIEKEVLIFRKIPKVYELGSRMSVILCPFELKGKEHTETEDILLGHLIDKGRFDMKDLGGLMADDQKDNSDDTAKNRAIQIARKLDADFVITGKVIEKKNSLQIYARMLETDTLTVLTEEDVYGEGEDAELIRQLCHGLAIKLCDAVPFAEGKIVKVKEKQIIVNIGKKDGIRRGMHMILFEQGEPLRDPDTGEELGSDAEEFGTARIEKIRPRVSYAQILDTSESLKPGMQVVMK
ncbi:caspase family protein [Desulfococcaceae bacterium HSG8]|nr:caspase family protein [Desulfococcaceae bacterium HSG8]